MQALQIHGMSLTLTKQYSKAVSLLSSTLAEQARTLGPDHQSVLSVACSLGHAYLSMGDFATANKVFSRAWQSSITQGCGRARMDQNLFKCYRLALLGVGDTLAVRRLEREARKHGLSTD